jgi:hypothetical protein
LNQSKDWLRGGTGMKVMSFTCRPDDEIYLKYILPALLDKTKIQTDRPAWKMESILKPHAIRHITGEENQFFKGNYISVDKKPRFKVGETVRLEWKSRNSPKGSWFFKNTGKIWNKEPSVYCCSSCLEDKEIGHGDDIEACCCRFPKCQEEILFPKILGTAKITEVFKIEMNKKQNGQFTEFNLKKLYERPGIEPEIALMESDVDKVLFNSGIDHMIPFVQELAKRDGFKSAEDMFRWFDKEYDLSVPKSFWVYRWEEDLR